MRTRIARSGLLPNPSRRALVLLGTTIVLLIVGVLGMHTLNGAGASHAVSAAHDGNHAVPVSPLVHVTHDAAPAVGPIAGSHAHCGDGCVAPDPGHEPGAPGHVGMAACVLALLAGLILLVHPTLLTRTVDAVAVQWRAIRATAARATAPRPSLTLLSISRT